MLVQILGDIDGHPSIWAVLVNYQNSREETALPLQFPLLPSHIYYSGSQPMSHGRKRPLNHC